MRALDLFARQFGTRLEALPTIRAWEDNGGCREYNFRRLIRNGVATVIPSCSPAPTHEEPRRQRGEGDEAQNEADHHRPPSIGLTNPRGFDGNGHGSRRRHPIGIRLGVNHQFGQADVEGNRSVHRQTAHLQFLYVSGSDLHRLNELIILPHIRSKEVKSTASANHSQFPLRFDCF